MSIYIQLFHGHHYPNEVIEEWGYEGPVLGPFPYFHTTYGCDNKIGDDGIVVMSEKIQFPVWDKDDYIPFLGSLYGDMSVFSDDLLKDELLMRHTRTSQVFCTPRDKVPLLINDPEEWIRIYASWILRGRSNL